MPSLISVNRKRQESMRHERPDIPMKLAAYVLCCTALCRVHAADSVSPTVGLEGRVEVVLPGTLLEARAVEHKAKLVLRIAETSPRDKAFWYDLRYIGMVPGSYDLRGYLRRTDGSDTNNLPAIPVTIAPLLPEKHDGKLIEPSGSALRRLGGYKALMIGAGVFWVLVFIPLLWRKRRAAAQVAAPAREPTLAERMRPLVEQAAQGTLSRDGQAQLERMLLTHWRQKLNLEGLAMVEAVAKLREHPQAGELLRSLESWLHRPPGSATVDINDVLKPYKTLPVDTVEAAENAK
jgi:hypothetical protein